MFQGSETSLWATVLQYLMLSNNSGVVTVLVYGYPRKMFSGFYKTEIIEILHQLWSRETLWSLSNFQNWCDVMLNISLWEAHKCWGHAKSPWTLSLILFRNNDIKLFREKKMTMSWIREIRDPRVVDVGRNLWRYLVQSTCSSRDTWCRLPRTMAILNVATTSLGSLCQCLVNALVNTAEYIPGHLHVHVFQTLYKV